MVPKPSASYLLIISVKKLHFTSQSVKMELTFRKRTLLLGTVCFSGVFFSYLVNGVLVEKVSRGEAFKFYVSMVFVPSVFNALLAKSITLVLGNNDENTEKSQTGSDHQPHVNKDLAKRSFENIPTHLFIWCSIFYVMSMTCANAALAYINYPTQILGKSVKPIAILFMNIVFIRKKYSVRKCSSIFLVVLGIILFMLENGRIKQQQGESVTYYGVILVVCSLTFDSLVAATQERMRASYMLDTYGLMFNINLWASVLLGSMTVISGEIWFFLNYCYTQPKILLHLAGLSGTGALGQNFIFLTITHFGPLACSVITTSRKFFTILLSTVLFNNVMSSLQWLYVLIVFIGLALDIFS